MGPVNDGTLYTKKNVKIEQKGPKKKEPTRIDRAVLKSTKNAHTHTKKKKRKPMEGKNEKRERERDQTRSTLVRNCAGFSSKANRCVCVYVCVSVCVLVCVRVCVCVCRGYRALAVHRIITNGSITDWVSSVATFF